MLFWLQVIRIIFESGFKQIVATPNLEKELKV
jgi:hypothetical protein